MGRERLLVAAVGALCCALSLFFPWWTVGVPHEGRADDFAPFRPQVENEQMVIPIIITSLLALLGVAAGCAMIFMEPWPQGRLVREVAAIGTAASALALLLAALLWPYYFSAHSLGFWDSQSYTFPFGEVEVWSRAGPGWWMLLGGSLAQALAVWGPRPVAVPIPPP